MIRFIKAEKTNTGWNSEASQTVATTPRVTELESHHLIITVEAKLKKKKKSNATAQYS